MMRAMLDPNSTEGRQLIEQLEGMIETKRMSLERPLFDFDKTQVLRGEIKAYRTVVQLIQGDRGTDEPSSS